MKTKVLITVKTYPSISSKYDELVCSAGFCEDGRMIRIYPVPYRKRPEDEQYKKYDWIEVDLVKNTSDFRPESYRPYDINGTIDVIGHLDTKKNWQQRKEFVLKNVHFNLAKLIAAAHDKEVLTSLAVFKPSRIIDFIIEKAEREWDKEKIATLWAHRMQMDLFKEPEDDVFNTVPKLPYKFSYRFVDDQDKESTLMIEDWEIGQLYWNCLRRHNGDEVLALKDVKSKFLDDLAKTTDLHFFLGTTLLNHHVSRNPFIIVGLFYPKKEQVDPQLSLF